MAIKRLTGYIAILNFIGRERGSAGDEGWGGGEVLDRVNGGRIMMVVPYFSRAVFQIFIFFFVKTKIFGLVNFLILLDNHNIEFVDFAFFLCMNSFHEYKKNCFREILRGGNSTKKPRHRDKREK